MEFAVKSLLESGIRSGGKLAILRSSTRQILSRCGCHTQVPPASARLSIIGKIGDNQNHSAKSKKIENDSLESTGETPSKGVPHFRRSSSAVDEAKGAWPHPIWSKSEADRVQINHRRPEGVVDRLAYAAVKTLRKGFDLVSGYTFKRYLGTLDERDTLRRCIFLETVAGVPGFAGGMVRHLHSLRRMREDHGWIHTLIEEAENERMHLMTFMELRTPGPFFRAAVVLAQGIFFNSFFLTYLISPRFCHRFVGYLEEEAVKTYSSILDEIDGGRLPMWSKLPAPPIAIEYWKLEPSALMRDVILVIRADEANHRQVNHHLAGASTGQ